MKIVLSGLPKGEKLYLVDAECEWNEHSDRLFSEEDGEYSLQLNAQPGEEFKLFVLCEVEDRFRVENALKQVGVAVTGIGDSSKISTEKWRVWFYFHNLPTTGSGVYVNNLWPDKEEGYSIKLYPEE